MNKVACLKKAQKRDASIPVGEPSPMHLDCDCGTRVDLIEPIYSRCPTCGITYDWRGWIVDAGSAGRCV